MRLVRFRIITVALTLALFLSSLSLSFSTVYTQQADAAGSFSVTGAYWQIGSSIVTTAHVGDTVFAKAIIEAQGGAVSGSWKIVVRKDISWGSDIDYAQDTGSLSLAEGESQTLSLSWSPDAASGAGGLDGYFIEVWFDGVKIYVMSSRLTVTSAPAAIAVVTNAYWQTGGSIVTTAQVGDTVYAKAVIEAQDGAITGSWKIVVRKDISLGSDIDYAQDTGSLSLAEGESQTLSLSWSPDAASGKGGLDGYFIEVWFDGVKIYVMSSRLTVTTTAAITSTHMPTPVPTDLWRKDIRSGDIVLDPTGASLLGILTFGHVGICHEIEGSYYIVEAIRDGVSLTPIEEWDKKDGVYVLRVNCNDDVAAEAASLAYGQIPKHYQPWYAYLNKSDDLNSPRWYCSELVWAVYKFLDIELEYTPDDYAISPWEIYKTTQVIYHHGPDLVVPSRQVPWWFYSMAPTWAEGVATLLHIYAECPVDLVVADPDGLTISQISSEIPDAIYMIDDFNDDGSPDTLVGIANGKIGTYDIVVIPQAEAESTDTYTLTTHQRAGTDVIADKVTISDTTDEPYSVEYIDEVVSFPSTNLEVAIRDAVNKPKGDIRQSDLDALISFDASSRNISDLTGIEHCINLQSIWLNNNQISDLEPLVDNAGLSQGDYIDLFLNPLSSESITVYIPTLEGRGVTLLYTLEEDTADSMNWIWIGSGIGAGTLLGLTLAWWIAIRRRKPPLRNKQAA